MRPLPRRPEGQRTASAGKILGNVPLLVTDLAPEVGATSEDVLMCLASIYADHPDYQEGWFIDGHEMGAELGIAPMRFKQFNTGYSVPPYAQSA